MSESCNPCIRKGLAILPVLYAVLPKKAVQGAGGELYPTPPKSPFHIDLTHKQWDALPKKKVGTKPGAETKLRESAELEDSAYYLRTMEPGYIYLLYPNKVWRGYMIDVAGHPRYYPDLVTNDMPSSIPEKSDVEACKRPGMNHTGIEAICIEDPESLKEPVWIAYSRAFWTPAVRKAYAKDPSPRMQKIERFDGKSFPHADIASATSLFKSVAEYNPLAVRNANKVLPVSAKLRDLHKKAEPLTKAMRAMSGTLDKPGLIMALNDPIGITVTLNNFRNEPTAILFGQDPEEDTKQDPKLIQQRRNDTLVVSVIDNLKESFEKDGKWPRHYAHLDPAKFDPVYKKYKARSEATKSLNIRSRDYLTWMLSDGTTTILDKDYDPDGTLSSLTYESHFVSCTSGSGVSKDERTLLWLPWFQTNPATGINFLWKALTANDLTLTKMLDDVKVDKLYDIAKGSYGAHDKINSTHWKEFLQDVRALPEARRRVFTNTTNKLTQMLAGQLEWLHDLDASAYRRTIGRFASVAMDRALTMVIPNSRQTKVGKYLADLMTHYAGQPKIKPQLPEKTATKNSDKPKAGKAADLTSAEFRTGSKEKLTLDNALLAEINGKDKAIEVEAFSVQDAKPGDTRPTKKEQLAKDIKIGSEESYLEKIHGEKTNIAISTVTGVFSLISLCRNLEKLKEVLNKDQKSEEDKEKQNMILASIGSSIMGTISVGFEISASRASIKTSKQAIQSIADKVEATATKELLAAGELLGKKLLVAAAGFAVVASSIDLYVTLNESEATRKKGDEGAADYALGSSIAGLASSFSALGAAVTEWLTLSAATVEAPPVAATIFVVGAVVLAIASVWLSFVSSDKVISDIERWLDQGRFGKHELPNSNGDGKIPGNFLTIDAEMRALHEAIYAVNLETEAGWSVGKTAFEATIRLPLHGEHTQIDIILKGTEMGGKEFILETRRFPLGSSKDIREVGLNILKENSFSAEKRGNALKIKWKISTPYLYFGDKYDTQKKTVVRRHQQQHRRTPRPQTNRCSWRNQAIQTRFSPTDGFQPGGSIQTRYRDLSGFAYGCQQSSETRRKSKPGAI